MEWITSPEIWVAFFTLAALEIVRRNVDRLSEAVEGAIDTIARD